LRQASESQLEMDITFKLLFEALGIVSFAITGMIVAKNHGSSALGTFLVALAAGLGGGTLRDILLDARPFYWEKYWFYIPLIFLMTVVYVLLPSVHEVFSKPRGILRSTIEAIAVASLGITGADKAAGLGQAWLMVGVYGVITAAFGGVLRDVLVNDFPLMFNPNIFLGEALFVGCLAFAGLEWIGLQSDVAALIGALLIFGIRMVAVMYERRQTSAPATAPAT
jgi:uncharacterized membrane protein YeiH